MKINRISYRILILAGTLCAAMAYGAAKEYFVGLDGDDAHDGLSRATAFRSVQRGVDALSEGDTLTILPGEYHEAVSREGLGGPDRDTLIRAAIPGTAILRGDLPAPAIRPLEGSEFLNIMEYDNVIQAVNETDTLRVLRYVPTLGELEFAIGAAWQCPETWRIHLTTSDLLPAAEHAYTLSVIPGHGLFLNAPERVVIEGITARGFNSTTSGPHFPGYGRTWGILLAEPKSCIIRNCTAVLNGAGIAMHLREGSGGNLVENCRAYGNPRAGINIYGANHDEIRGSLAWRCGYIGIGFYGQGITGPAILRNNIGWGNSLADIRIKGGPGERIVSACIGLGNFDVNTYRHCLIGRANAYDAHPAPDNILLAAEQRLDPDTEFADPANLDYRLQAGSRFRGAGPGGIDRGPFPYTPDIFYIAADGMDTQDGLAADTAWRSLDRALGLRFLRGGDTVYLEGGGRYTAPRRFSADGQDAGMIAVRGRGRLPAIIEGPLVIEDSRGLLFDRVHFKGPVSITGSRNLVFHNCRFSAPETALTARDVNGLRITHARFENYAAAAICMTAVTAAHIADNLFHAPAPAIRHDGQNAPAYSDYNIYRHAPAAWNVDGRLSGLKAVQSAGYERYALTSEGHIPAGGGSALRGSGPYPVIPPRVIRLAGPVIHSAADRSVNIEWRSSAPVRAQIAWGAAPDNLTARRTVSGTGFTSVSLTDLEPGREYYLAITDVAPDADDDGVPVDMIFDGQPVKFATLAEPPAPVTYYVAPDGDDRHNGLDRTQAWRTLGRAAAGVAPGDTVLVAGGVYSETVRARVTGQPERPVVFRALPGERVVLDGAGQTLASAFVLTYKNHIHLDGFYFEGYGARGWTGVIDLFHSDAITITRCFKNRRGRGSSPSFVNAVHSAGLTMRNCVITGAFQGMVLRGCPDALIENCVFLRNWIQAIIVNNNPGQTVTLRRNIFTDSTPDKVRGGLMEFARAESLVDDTNCYFLRVPDDQRRMFFFYGDFEYERALQGYDIEISYPQPPLVATLTRMSLAEYRAQLAPENRSLVRDPRFKGAVALDVPDDAFAPDRLAGQRNLDFPDLFAADPEIKALGIGLQPDAFRDMYDKEF